MTNRESMYVNGFDAEEEKQINSIPVPWQRSFINNFYTQLQKKKTISKKSICEHTNANYNGDRLDLSYKLHPNTLSQYTDYKSKNYRPICIDGLIAVSDALNVSINYLLGIDSCENAENTSVNQIIGLSNDSIDVLKRNKELQELLDIILQSPHLDELMKDIANIFYSEYISDDILNAYSINLREILETAFCKYETTILPIDRSPIQFQKILIAELPFKSISPIVDYLSKNVSSDRYNQIMISSSNNDDESIYKSFIKDTVSCVFDTLSYKGKSDYYNHILFNSFSVLINDYLKTKASILKYNLHNRAHESL